MDGTVRIRSVVWFATAVVISVFATVLVMQTWQANAAPGDTDSTYVPVANCRLFDFRPGADNVGPKKTPLTAGPQNAYTQSVHGANGECNIPSDATAVAMNVTITNPTAQSNLTVFPADINKPKASNLNWLAGQSPTPNKVDVKLSPDGKIRLQNHAGTVNVIGDIVGYYTAKSLKELANGGTAGPQGPTGARGFSAWDIIPSGVTVTGVWRFDSHTQIGNVDFMQSVSLPARAPSVFSGDSQVNFAADLSGVTVDDDPQCTGSANAPTAPAGTVCLYPASHTGVKSLRGQLTHAISDQTFVVYWIADGVGDMYVEVAWAYTAP